MFMYTIALGVLHFTAAQPSWIKEPPKNLYVEETANATFTWEYDLQGNALEFAQWGMVKEDKTWDRNFITQVANAPTAVIVSKYERKVKWKPNATMILINVTVEESRLYGCIVNAAGGHTLDSTVRLNVFRLVQTNQSTSAIVSPVEGRNFTASFDAVVNYRPSAIWYKDGIQLQHNGGFNFTEEIIGKHANFIIYRFSIFKESAHRTDSGYYNGFITFGGRQYHYKNSTVLVKYAPENKTEFRTSTGSHILLEGTSPSLLCNSVSYPLPSYDIWKLPTSVNFTLNGTLTLHNVNMAHRGIYHCQPKNEIGFGGVTSLQIEIGSIPQHTNKKTNQYVSKGGNIVLTCAINGWPIPDVTWLKDGTRIKQSYMLSNTTTGRTIESKLSIKNATLDDAGNFTCKAENMFGMRASDQNMDVYWLIAKDTSTSTNFTPTEGSNFTFAFDIAVNLEPTVIWFRNGARLVHGYQLTKEVVGLHGNYTIYRFSLFKPMSNMTDSGRYEAYIIYGDHRIPWKQFTLTITVRKPQALAGNDEPTDEWIVPLIIACVALFIVLLAIPSAIFYGKRLQVAERQRRSDKSQEASTADANSNTGNHNVSFEGLDNSGFSRESIQRFTVNPMFATSERDSERDSEENLVVNDDAMYLPASHMMYLPSIEDYSIDEAFLSFGEEESREPSPEQQPEEEPPQTEGPQQEEPQEEEEPPQEAELPQEDEPEEPPLEEEPEEPQQEEEIVNKSFTLPPISQGKVFTEGNTNAAYVADLFDFR